MLELDDKTLQSYFVHAKRIVNENRHEFQMFLLHKKHSSKTSYMLKFVMMMMKLIL